MRFRGLVGIVIHVSGLWNVNGTTFLYDTSIIGDLSHNVPLLLEILVSRCSQYPYQLCLLTCFCKLEKLISFLYFLRFHFCHYKHDLYSSLGLLYSLPVSLVTTLCTGFSGSYFHQLLTHCILYLLPIASTRPQKMSIF